MTNCCNEYGECTLCDDCPARPGNAQSKYPVVVDCDCEPDWTTLLIWVALAFMLTAVVALNLGYWMHA